MARLPRIPLIVAVAGMAMAICFGWVVASASVPARFSYHRGTGGAAIRTTESTGIDFNSDEEKPRPLIVRKVAIPPEAHRLAVITLSAVCSHSGGDPEDYTTVEAVARSDGQRRFAFGGSAPDLVFCSDLGDGANYKAAASHTWTLPLDGGFNKVVIRYASVGGGVAHLRNVVLDVALYKHPCCP
jgi:hypothetical protein